MWSEYFIPSSLDEALDLLSRHARQDGARVIAGGTDLVIELDRGMRRAGALIDISRLPGLDHIRLDDGGRLHIGPLVTHSQAVASRLIVERAFPLARACREVGAPQIRNRATIAGNLITASPANDTITPLLAMDAAVTLTSARGRRTVALSGFYTGVRRTVMAGDEMLTDIAFPALDPARQCGTFIKLGLRSAQAISVVNGAAVLTMDDGRPTTETVVGRRSSVVVTDARIALGAVAPTVVRAREAETALRGERLTPELIDRAARLAQSAATPIDDVRATAAYRRSMVAVVVRRALTQLLNGVERDAWGDEPALLQLAADAVSAEGARGAEPTENEELAPSSNAAPPATRAAKTIRCIVNGRAHAIDGAQDKTLLRMLREDCGLTGTKEGCAEGECGACTVIMDGKAVMACLVPAPRAHGTRIVTVEGVSELAAAPADLHPLQAAFIAQGAVQCGYCTPGLIVSGAALLSEHPRPTQAQIKEGISGNLCRCTGYYKILSAFERAASQTALTE